jgi:predicted nucleic acid-binding protein
MKMIDSSIWIEFLRKNGDPSVKGHVAQLISAEQAAYTCPIRFELVSGALPHELSNPNPSGTTATCPAL